MKIDDTFGTTIRDIFYDKSIDVYETTNSTDKTGWNRTHEGSKLSSFMGNAHFNNFDRVQAEYGIKDQIDMTVTTDTAIAKNTLIKYNSILYIVNTSVKNDSHYLLICMKWISKSGI